MWKSTNEAQRYQQKYDEAQLYWRARDAYRMRRGLHSGVLACLLLEGLMIAGLGLWETAIMVVGMQGVIIWGLAWLVRGIGRRTRIWRHGLRAVALLSVMLNGCTTVVREVAHLNGYAGDIYASDCLPESLQAGYCIHPSEPKGAKP